MRIVLSASLAVMSGLLVPAAANCQSQAYDACIAAIDHAGFVKSQMLDCATKDMDRADGQLNLTYRRIIAGLATARRSALIRSERRWILRRHDLCLISRQPELPSPEINRMLCLVRETDRREQSLTRLR